MPSRSRAPHAPLEYGRPGCVAVRRARLLRACDATRHLRLSSSVSALRFGETARYEFRNRARVKTFRVPLGVGDAPRPDSRLASDSAGGVAGPSASVAREGLELHAQLGAARNRDLAQHLP